MSINPDLKKYLDAPERPAGGGADVDPTTHESGLDRGPRVGPAGTAGPDGTGSAYNV